jgi:hypothetical protein
MEITEHPSLVRILEVISDYLNREKIPYAIVGGVAVIVYGYPRATQDIDLVVDQTVLDIGKFCAYLRQHHFQADEHDLQKAFEETSHAIIFHEKISIHLDVKGAYTSSDRDTLRTAATIRFDKITIKLSTPESLICHKLLFGSGRDLEDALAIYQRMKPKLSDEELTRIARLLGVEKNLQELKEAAEQSLSEQKEWAQRHFE